MPCITTCGQTQHPIDGDTLAPFARVFFGDSKDPTISVGNQSSPQWGNTAVIKSLQVGLSNGVGVKVEIMDELGGSFHQFIEKLNKCIGKPVKANEMMGVEWGWIVSNCDGSKELRNTPGRVYLIPQHVEAGFAEGRIKFTISCVDSSQPVFVAREDDVEGADDLRVPLKTAIQNLCSSEAPIFDVEYVRKSGDGTHSKFGFQVGGDLGPKDVWRHDGQNKLSTIQKWIEPFLTDNEKGIILVWDASRTTNRLVLLEDPMPDCNEAVSCANSVGTYVVNGGKHSAVISFTPTINFLNGLTGLATGGNSGGAGSAEPVEQNKKCSLQNNSRRMGILQSIPGSNNTWDIYGPKQSVKEKQKGQAANAKANQIMAVGPIEAELRIQGDNRLEFMHPVHMVGKSLSLVVINPFYISGSGCGDWIAQPVCNDILSNKNWKIMGADHLIKEGSYVTTLKIQLAGTGVQVPDDSPFGGPGSQGYVPLNAC